MSAGLMETEADARIETCLDNAQSFCVIAGAGSGKTTSLILALSRVRQKFGARLRKNSQRVVCLTYTKRAVAVISSRLGWDDLYVVRTLHSFLWDEIKRYSNDIRRELLDGVVPDRIEKKRAEDNGGKSKAAIAARNRVSELEDALQKLANVKFFDYGDSEYSDYEKGKLGHDDVLEVAARLIASRPNLQRVIGLKFPYLFIDEAQDTDLGVMNALNAVCAGDGLPLIGYFGDPMQQIYDKRAGEFVGPDGYERISKAENFRCSRSVVTLLNAFRRDLQQVPAGENANVVGSVELRLIQSEEPQEKYNRYSADQLERASAHLDEALQHWGWSGRDDVKQLFLVRQMIARRLGFVQLQKLFTGPYASSRAQEGYESGEHGLLKPFATCLVALHEAVGREDGKTAMAILHANSPAFEQAGANAKKPLKAMTTLAESALGNFRAVWENGNVGDVLRYARDHRLAALSDTVLEHLARGVRTEDYNPEIHALEKADWLADAFFAMPLDELASYVNFVHENTPYSTQHGVKGEEYPNVLVVFDDIGSAWNQYSFCKTLTPTTSSAPTERQAELTSKLAYVCFSRAERDLRIVMYASNPAAAKNELVERGYFNEEQVSIQH